MKNSNAALKKFQKDFTQHIRNPVLNAKPENVPARRMNVYNELLFNTIEDVLAGCFPICKEVLGKRKWKNLVRDFFTQHVCVRPFYRQVPEEFVEYLSEERKKSSDPKFLPYLAHYEWMELNIYSSPENKPYKLLAYPYPVHQIKKETSKKIKESNSYYFFYRDNKENVDWMLLSPAQAKLVHLILDKSYPLQKAFAQIAKELKMPEEFITRSGMENLKKWKEMGIVL